MRQINQLLIIPLGLMMICLYVCYPVLPQILQESTALQIIGHFSGEHADLVVCDGAPDGSAYLKIYHLIVDGIVCVCVCMVQSH